jgi:dTDP-4-dehydrorhamnose 3,5-epimerase
MGREVRYSHTKSNGTTMIFKETNLQGAFVIEPEMLTDERGAFARIFCKKEFKNHGLNPNIFQCSISLNKEKFTLRGMHFQKIPHAEAKLVRCSRGLIYDVIVDLRPNSPTYMGWTSIEISLENKRMVYVPEGFAHGFQTLEDNTEVIYQMSQFYSPGHSGGFRWDDPSFNIEWPTEPIVISPKDKIFSDFRS